MTYSSSITEERMPLVFDTSVVINLYACTYGERILAALPNAVIIPRVVAGELQHETSQNDRERNFLHDLVIRGRVTLGKMTDKENELFTSLVSGSPSIGDGEAATIAIAANRQLTPLLDDRKARAIAMHALPSREPGWSLDLFRHSSVTSALGETTAIKALYLALREGRMRIPVESTKYIIGLLGNERARKCSSLPDYRKLFDRSARQCTTLKLAGC